MITFFNVIFRPTKAFLRIQNEYEGTLIREGMLLFIVLGIFSFSINGVGELAFPSMLLWVGGLAGHIGAAGLGGALLALMLYSLGKYLGGTAAFADMFVLVAYASCVFFFGQVFKAVFNDPGLGANAEQIRFWRQFISYLFLLWYLKILLHGLVQLHHFGIGKAMLTLLPWIIVSAGVALWVLSW